MNIGLILIIAIASVVIGLFVGAGIMLAKVFLADLKSKNDYQNGKILEVKDNPEQIVDNSPEDKTEDKKSLLSKFKFWKK